ncbi:hypothetical protein KJ766_03900 [Patescibacteria group bacterium]|nr:hypothetical protein [Patescibacteria group bacterium]
MPVVTEKEDVQPVETAKNDIADPREEFPIIYGEYADVDVSYEFVTFASIFSAQTLLSQAQECGNNIQGSDYFQNLVSDLSSSVPGVKVVFTYTGESQGDSSWVMHAFPNTKGYNDLAELEYDFDACYAGGNLYPFKVTTDYIYFSSSTGTGYDDGSGLPNGPEKAHQIVSEGLIFR